MRNTGLDEAQAGIKILRININNLKNSDDTILMAESKEELHFNLIIFLKQCLQIEPHPETLGVKGSTWTLERHNRTPPFLRWENQGSDQLDHMKSSGRTSIWTQAEQFQGPTVNSTPTSCAGSGHSFLSLMPWHWMLEEGDVGIKRVGYWYSIRKAKRKRCLRKVDFWSKFLQWSLQIEKRVLESKPFGSASFK